MPRFFLFRHECMGKTIFEYYLPDLPGIHDDAVKDALHERLYDGGIYRGRQPFVGDVVPVGQFLSNDEL